ncbi:MAG: hypothetical protein ABID09_01160 [Candidatus Omnitrophota bacterium]
MKRRRFGKMCLLLIVVSFVVIVGTVVNESFAMTVKQAELIKARAASILSSQPWTIYLSPENARKGLKSEADVLNFTEKSVSSKNLLAKGYPVSNYAVRANEDGSVSWETMQVNEVTKDRVFLSGRLNNGALNGVYFHRPKTGDTETYRFTSTTR